MLVIAHRGASARYPENTMLAFDKAIEAGAGMIEMDVRLTRDGRVIVFHDAGLRRVFRKPGRVAAMTYDALRRQSSGSIPLLSDAILRLRKKVLLYIEIKAERLRPRRRQLLARKVWEIITAQHARRECLVASFDYRVIQQYRRLDPSGWTGFIFARKRPYRRVAAGGLACVDVLCPHKSLLTRDLVSQAHARRRKVYAWVLDDSAEQKRASQLSVDGIVTNDPKKMAIRFHAR